MLNTSRMFSNFEWMAAFIDDVMNSLHPKMLFFSQKKKNPLRTYNSLKFFPVSSVHIDISSQRMGNWRVSCFSISGDTASGCPVLRESSSLFGRVKSFCPMFLADRLTISCRYTWELPTSAFEQEPRRFPVARPTLSCCVHSPDWLEIPIPVTRHPLCTDLATPDWCCNCFFAIGDPSLEVVSCPRFGMAPITRRSLVWEKELFEWLPEYVENTWCWINTESDSTHLSRNFLYLESAS